MVKSITFMTDDQAQKLTAIINAAIRVFHCNGYKLTQMSDIADEMDGAVGSIYIYAKGKQALFDLCLIQSFVEDFPGKSLELPFAGMDHQKILAQYVRPSLLKEQAEFKRYLKTTPLLEEVVQLLFSLIARYWQGIKLLDTTVNQWPLLYDFYQSFRISSFEILAAYLEEGVKKKKIRPVKNILLSSRLIFENIAYFAMHRKYDSLLSDLDEEVARDLTVDAMVHAFQVQG